MKRLSDVLEPLKRKKRVYPSRKRQRKWNPPCLNCDSTLSEDRRSPYLFCSTKCRQTSGYIRYYRRALADGRIDHEDVREALLIRGAFILAGGYPEAARRIPSTLRAQVVKRFGGLCAKCGRPGGEIDHIRGSSNDLENLQLLCRPCHVEKTKHSLIPIEDLPPDAKAVAIQEMERIEVRIYALNPLRICDDEANWPSRYKQVAAERRHRMFHATN